MEKYLKISQIRKKNKDFFLIFLVFLFPLLNFLGNNIYQLTQANVYQISYYNLALFFVFCLFSFIISRLTKKNTLSILTMLVVAFWISFQFENFKDLFNKITVSFSTEFSILTLIFIILIFLRLFLNYKQNFIRFFIIFFIIQYSFLLTQIYKNYFYNENELSLIGDNILEFDQNYINKIKNKKNRNIYYLILDEMTSIKEFKIMYGNKYEEINKIYELDDFHYLDDYSSFNLTTLTLASILNLNRIVEVGENISNYNHNKILFPKNLSKVNFKTYEHPNLLKLLEKINYQFIWIGNNWAKCYDYNEDLCLKQNSKNKEANLINNINLVLINIFLKTTPFDIIIRKTTQLLNNKVKFNLSGNDFEENDAIKKLMRSKFKINKNKNYFFLIHHFSPHKPYIYDSNCNYDGSLKTTLKDDLDGYKNNYLCALNKIDQFLKFIKTTDEDAILVIQGDHGFKNDDNLITKIDKNKFKIFNLIKTNKDCKNDYKAKKFLGNINSVRVALSCAIDEEIPLIENYPVYSNKMNKKFGIVKKFNLN